MPVPKDPFIFVSYSRKDSDFVHPEIERLERQGYKIWYDKGELQPGSFWDEQIRQAIGACACFIVFITQDAVDSENVCDEMDQALKAGKPFICIHWEKVELPPHFRKPLRSIQSLERYSLRRFEYEEPLSRALSEYIKTEPPPEEKKSLEEEPVPQPSVTSSDVLPKIVYFSLILLGVIFFCFAVVAVVSPHLASYPGDPLSNRWVGYLVSLFFIVIAFGLGGGAFAVHRIYLRRRKNG